MIRQACLRRYGVFAAATMLWSSLAWADQMAQARVDVNLRAGPNREYPVVSALRAGTQFTVLGCLGDYSWCDVQAPPYRGWVYAENLLIFQPNGDAAALNVAGALVGIGVTTFILNNYWRDHYYNRPWYGQSNYWNSRPVPYYGRPGYYPPPAYRPPAGPPPTTAGLSPATATGLQAAAAPSWRWGLQPGRGVSPAATTAWRQWLQPGQWISSAAASATGWRPGQPSACGGRGPWWRPSARPAPGTAASTLIAGSRRVTG